MTASMGKSQTIAAPPRTLNVTKFADSRASELEALHSVIAGRLNKDFRFQRNKRRRTTGYDNRVGRNKGRKKRKVDGIVGASENGAVEKDGDKKLPRRVRRRIELIKNARSESGFSTSGDGTKRLRTHVWHAKRFTMTKLWGFHLPLGKQGRGRGSRALLKKLKNGVLVHDASYHGTLQLEGPEDLLLSILRAILEPCPSRQSDLTSQNILSGDIYGSGILHYLGELSSQVVAPVTYMWRPRQTKIYTEGQNCDVLEQHETVDTGASFRQLWIWLHPAAFEEGFEILKSACEKVNVTGRTVNCMSLADKLGKLEMIGFGAFHLIQKILHPAACIQQNPCALRKCSTANVDNKALAAYSYELKNEEEISTSAIISLLVNDPRSFVAKEIVDASNTPSEILGSGDAEVHGETSFTGNSSKKAEIASSLSLGPTEGSALEFVDLWDSSKGAIPPVAESVLCLEKHNQRMKFFCLSEKRSLEQNASEEKSSPLCPVILLKNSTHERSMTRWSIVLPLSWLKVFWDVVVSNGAQAIGVREMRWVACELGLPCFPSDFPDSNAYSCFMAMESAVANQKAIQCPPATKQMKVPIQLPWDCVRCSLYKAFLPSTSRSESVINNSMKNLKCEKCSSEVICSRDVPFDGHVTRTSAMLSHFLTQTEGDHLLLFPEVADGNRNLSKLMSEEKTARQQTNEVGYQFRCCSKLCFLRVELQAFKEGVFEEGAVVCAPHASDISMWKNRSEDARGKLQTPASLLSSFFVQRQSGKWELNEPESPEAREFYRWPIGFITSGFVHGSKKPMALAICEATLLARLREEQWNYMPVRQRRKEIYVLVRNLRSTAYRLALATIVLEAQEDDLAYM